MISLRKAWREATKREKKDNEEIKRISAYVYCDENYAAKLLRVHRAIEEFCNENVDYRILYRMNSFPLVMLHDKEYTQYWYNQNFVKLYGIGYLTRTYYLNDSVKDALNLYYESNNINEDTQAHFISLVNKLEDMRMNER